MATPEQIPTDLTLEIGVDLSPDRFIATARAFFGYVQVIGRRFASPDGKRPHWIVRVREGSTLLAVDLSPKTSPPFAEMIFDYAESGIRSLLDGNFEESVLPEDAIGHLKVLAELAEGGPDKPAVPLRFWINHKPIPIEPGLASLIREDRQADYRDYGTIEGRLHAIQESQYGGLQFQLLDLALRLKVRCDFPEDLLPEVFDKFRKRVEVSGMIHYRRNGTPISIAAEHIDALPDDRELPTARDVRGILRH
jgi:hypothetical protein